MPRGIPCKSAKERRRRTRLRCAAWRAANLDAVRAHDRIRNKSPERVAQKRARYKTEAYRKMSRTRPQTKYRIARRIRAAGRPPPLDGRCEECRRVRKLHFDHDHETKRFRGWICNRCNVSIGALGDTREGLQRAIAYLDGELPWQSNPLPGINGVLGFGA